MELTIYNCHIHTFPAEHIPDRFLPFGLVKAMGRKRLRIPILRDSTYGKMTDPRILDTLE